jgi:hypothetical protein
MSSAVDLVRKSKRPMGGAVKSRQRSGNAWRVVVRRVLLVTGGGIHEGRRRKCERGCIGDELCSVRGIGTDRRGASGLACRGRGLALLTGDCESAENFSRGVQGRIRSGPGGSRVPLSSPRRTHVRLHARLVFVRPMSPRLQLGFLVGRRNGWWLGGWSGLTRACLQLERGTQRTD